MENKAPKRRRDSLGGDAGDNKSTKRRQKLRHKNLDADELKLIKLYEDLAAESDDVRLEAAKQIIVRFSPEAQPAAEAVEKALNRIVRGLCSQRKAARVGFCVTLTELLRQLFSTSQKRIEGLNLDLKSIIALVEEKTKVEGNVPGQERRDHLIGKLFGYKAIMQSSILLEPDFSSECWCIVLDHIYSMAHDVPWLREECGLILVEAVKGLKDDAGSLKPVEELVNRLESFKLTNTPEGVAIWIAVHSQFKKALPSNVWHHEDPLSKKERSRLAKILKEDFRNSSSEVQDEVIKSAAANPNPIFAWDVVLFEILRRDGGEATSKRKDIPKVEFPQFWLDTVDGNLLSSASSHEKKLWGLKLFAKLITTVPDWAVSALFSPNLMRTLINQSRKGDRFLHAAALTSLKAIHQRVQGQSSTALLIFVAMTTKNGTIDFDKLTQTKTLEQIMLSTDDKTLRKIIKHLQSLILRPEAQESGVAAARRQTIVDLFLNTVKQYKHYASDSFSTDEEDDSWLRSIFETLVEHAYFIPTENAKTSKVPLPSLSDATRKIFQERLASCLTRLLKVDTDSRAFFAKLVISIIRTKASSSKNLTLVFKADKSVMKTIDNAFQSLDAIVAKKSKSSQSTSDGLVLLYSIALLQVFEGDTDAVLLLDDLEAAQKSLDKKSKSASQDQSPFVEIILTFLGNPRVLFRNIAQDAFAIFATDITSEGLQSLTELLDTPENENGQKELFAQGDEDVEDASSHGSGDEDEASDVEMIDGESNDSEDNASDVSDSESSDDSDDEESAISDGSGAEDEELAAFDNLLAQTLQTSKPDLNASASEDSSDESDMDDDQMMALDPHLAKIFKERSKTTNKKKQRQDAKQTVLQFKSRVLDLLSIYLEKQYSNPLGLEVLVPLLRRIRAGANNPLTKKIDGIIKGYTITRKNRKAALPKPEDIDHAWKILDSIHEEMKLGGSSLHATACSNASLHLVKVLVNLDKANYSKVVDVYSEIQKEWFMEKKSKIQPILFTALQTWSTSVKHQGKY